MTLSIILLVVETLQVRLLLFFMSFSFILCLYQLCNTTVHSEVADCNQLCSRLAVFEVNFGHFDISKTLETYTQKSKQEIEIKIS